MNRFRRGVDRLSVAACLFSACIPAPAGVDSRTTFIVDGSFREWQPLHDGPTPAPVPNIRLAADAWSVYGLLEMGETTNLQALDGTVRLLIDADAQASTGELIDGLAGVDLVIEFAPPGEAGMRVRLPPDTTWRDSYSIALAYAPTHASDRFEISWQRVARDGLPLITGPQLRARVSARDGAQRLLSSSDVITLDVAPPQSPAAPGLPASLIARAPGTELRVVAWNLGDRTALQHPLPLARILAALDADVFLLDEINPAIDAALLRSILPDRSWTLFLGENGGRQRTAVASRLPLRPARAVARVDYPDSLQDLAGMPMSSTMRQDLRTAAVDGVPTQLVIATVGGRNVLVVPLDLLCCGRMGSVEDRARIMTTDALASAIRAVVAAGEADAVIVGGDLNLVGSTRPLEVLVAGVDPGGADLEVVGAATLDGTSVNTWRSPSPFPPGRLDWLLFSPSALDVLRGFIFDEQALADDARRSLRLEAGDSDVADHLPVVADFRVIRGPNR